MAMTRLCSKCDREFYHECDEMCKEAKMYQKGRADAIDEVYSVVTNFLVNSNSELDFNLALQNKILDLKYEKNS